MATSPSKQQDLFAKMSHVGQHAYIDDYLSANVHAVPFGAYEMFQQSGSINNADKQMLKETMNRFWYASHPTSEWLLLPDRLNHKNISGFAFLHRKNFSKLCRALTLAALKNQLSEDEA